MSIREEWERRGLDDFFNHNEENRMLMCSVGKMVTGNNVDLNSSSTSEVLRLILLHGQSIYAVLNKKNITKKIIFSYLSDKNIPIIGGNQANKPDLIEMTVNYWKEKYSVSGIPPQSVPITPAEPNIVINVHSHINVTGMPAQPSTEQASSQSQIQELAEGFVRWFFEKVNSNSIAETDLWSDSTCAIRLIDASNSCRDMTGAGDSQVRDMFLDLRQQMQFLFNPNTCSVGTQGRMNKFGMVMVASCGTIHQNDCCVGVFESAFGLVRDTDNADTWKLKHTKMQIKSTNQDVQPRLEQCETLREILMPGGD